LEILLTRRHIWDALGSLAYPHYRIDDIRGNVHPLKFADRLCASNRSTPDFPTILGTVADFEAADTPKWNSEPSVSAFLGELAFRLQPAAIVEFGCFVGWTSAYIALGTREAGGLGSALTAMRGF
jgi:predicted O-methyltransferase YrrM